MRLLKDWFLFLKESVMVYVKAVVDSFFNLINSPQF